ncbi:hypothetical protein CH63R_01861 [Colletotrichum higginsianum IMI 349063]|uniref:Uncharacterized protein n=1 Tax=Colletotrichum higginsianum (strain IMI 349063) TaxID=759273 RepID=A0A1B7YM54_COLHI|nr:hypothetical protein CH63R_01861 [Colletotrichum higginsianum IMI 349063]OBR13135.1 hypothetical protein CH63R_01861 [Colletotrichum higginsianum IMI 349063]GJC96196.1 hypothetical protein ColKHC_05022 [Colletotrichum higginsianum]
MSHSSQNTRSGALTRSTRDDTTMTRTRRTYSPSSRSRSSSAGPRGSHHHRRPSIKTAAVFIAAVAVASLCVHKLWPRGTSHSKKQDWDQSLTPPGRRSRRRNAIRDRHNGYLDYDDHNVFDRNDYYRPHDNVARGALPRGRGESYYPPRVRGGDGRSRGYGSDSDGDSYYSDDYLPSPSERFSGRRGTIEGGADRRGRSRGFGGADEENEVVRYEKQSNRSEADRSRFEEERPERPRYNEAVEDWSRRGGQRYPSPSEERGYRGEPDYVDRRSRRRSDY